MGYCGIENKTDFLKVFPEPIYLGETPSMTGETYEANKLYWIFSTIDGHLTVVSSTITGTILYYCQCVREMLKIQGNYIKDLIKTLR